jgi:hypothetical protein
VAEQLVGFIREYFTDVTHFKIVTAPSIEPGDSLEVAIVR